MIIRKEIYEDISQLENLFLITRQQTFSSRPHDKFQLSDYKKSTADDEVWVAEENGIILGFVSVYLADNFIHNLFVFPKYQGIGVGAKLLKFAEENLLSPMTLKISMDNLRVGNFYKKYGWYQVSVYKDAEEQYVLFRKD